jgi:hypothetical protein
MGFYIKEEPLGRILMAYPGKKYFNGYIEALQLSSRLNLHCTIAYEIQKICLIHKGLTI